jgi:catechol 2,3-dioxygenase-like lactoylglutathione lyase family enzyme|tara:strand:- start:2113 stop:2541 length:429 start_codon:yes stop_codon:yes gene_type:complete
MPSIRHTGIVVTDIEKSIDFYRQYFGFEVQKDMIESGEYIDNFCSLEGVKVRTVKMALENGDMIELLDFISHPEENNEKRINNIGCTHFALTIENLDELYSAMTNNGVFFNCCPQFSPDGRAKATFCTDPDGTFIELVEILN